MSKKAERLAGALDHPGWLVRRIPLVESGPASERANATTHGAGLLLSVVAVVFLLDQAARAGGARLLAAFLVYSFSLLNLYAASTLYHSARGPRLKRLFRVLDHASIYVLIAGTYTPVALCCLPGTVGWVVFGVEWGLALGGILFKIFCLGKLRVLSVAFYVGMGYLIVAAWRPLVAFNPPGLALWILAGGLFYTLGVVFYALKRLPFHHAVWHLFVMAGSLCHFAGIYLYAARHLA